MSRPNYYQPKISRFLISVLHHEAKHRRIPMTRLVAEILELNLKDRPGWKTAINQISRPTEVGDITLSPSASI